MSDHMFRPLDILQFFQYEHLPKDLQIVSKPFCTLASDIAQYVPNNPERSMALRKLLEAKDACVRAAKYVERKKDICCRGQISEARIITGEVVSLDEVRKSQIAGAAVWSSREACRAAGRKETGFYGTLNDKENSITPVRFQAATHAAILAEALEFASQWGGYNRLSVTLFENDKHSEPTCYALVNGGWVPVESAEMSIADVSLSPEGDAGQQAKQLGLNFERSFLADVLASLIKAGASLKLAEALTETLEFARGSGAYLRRFSSQFAPFLDCFTEQLRKVNVIVVSSVRASDGSVLIAIGKDEEVLTAALNRREGGPPGPAPVEVSETREGPTVDELVKRAMHFQGGAMAAGSNSYPISCKDVCDQASVILSEMGILSCSLELEPGKIHFFAGGQQEALDGCIEAAKRRVSNPNWDRQA